MLLIPIDTLGARSPRGFQENSWTNSCGPGFLLLCALSLLTALLALCWAAFFPPLSLTFGLLAMKFHFWSMILKGHK